MTDVFHYDIRAVTGVTRAACGIDNRLNNENNNGPINYTPLKPAPYQATNNRNEVTCQPCLDKIEILAVMGGDAIQAPSDVDNRRWFINAFKDAAKEWDAEFPPDNEFRIMKQAAREAMDEYQGTVEQKVVNVSFDNEAFAQGVKSAMFGGDDLVEAVKFALAQDAEENDEEYESWHRDIIMKTLQEHTNAAMLSQRLLLKQAVTEAAAEGKFKFNTEELGDVIRGQVHRALNSRIKEKEDFRSVLNDHRRNYRNADNAEMTRIINSALNVRLAEASYLVGKDFMDSDKVKMLLVETAKAGAKEAFDDTTPRLLQWIGAGTEEILETHFEENPPVNFVQNNYSPETLSAADVYKQTKGLITNPSSNLKTAYKVSKPVPVNFDRFTHQELGDWAVANDLVRQWQFDTNMTRSQLKMLQEDGKLIHPGEDEPRR